MLAELLLAGRLVFGGPRRLTVALAVAIHAYAALAFNVWFFGLSMVAQVWLLLPKTEEELRLDRSIGA